LASGGSDAAIRLWDVSTSKEILCLQGHQEMVLSVSWSPDGKTLASGSKDKTIRLWNASTGKQIRSLVGHQNDISSVAWSPDGKTLASGSPDKTIRLWDASTGKEIRSLKGHQERVSSVSWSPDGKTLASGSWDKTIRLWDAASGREICFFGTQDLVDPVVWSPDGKMLASGGWDNTVHLWEVASRKEIRALVGHQDIVTSVCWSPDGTILASGSQDNTIRLWDVSTGKPIRSLMGHRFWISCVTWFPDGTRLASASADTTILVWSWGGLTPSLPVKLDKQTQRLAWKQLADPDPRVAWAAIARLQADPDSSTALLHKALSAVPATDPKVVQRLLQDLDTDEFDLRQKAEEQLQKLGDRATAGLQRFLDSKPPLEAAHRAERLLAAAESANTPERLRMLRSVTVLEKIGTPEARKVLQAWSRGAEGALLTREARAALHRLQRQARTR
jgi:WD40 repeat protein